MRVKSGSRLRCAICTSEVIVITAPADEVELQCGGELMLPIEQSTSETSQKKPHTDFGEGTSIGKRYVDAEAAVELLCTKAGTGSLPLSGHVMGLKSAKPLPSSD